MWIIAKTQPYHKNQGFKNVALYICFALKGNKLMIYGTFQSDLSLV